MKQLNYLMILLLVFVLAACTPGNLSYTDAQQRNSKKLESDAQRKDADFLVEAANYNIFFSTTATRASQEAYARVVADFAREALEDHKRMEESLKKLAKDQKIAIPSQMSDRHQQMANELNAASQRTFDKAYLSSVEALYERAINLYEDAALRANDSNIRAYAASKLDILRANERKSDELENQLL